MRSGKSPMIVSREQFVLHKCKLVVKESELECACVNNDDFTILVSGGSRCR